MNDASIGGMVSCDSSEQAKQMFTIFNEVYATHKVEDAKVSEPTPSYKVKRQQDNKVKSAQLILHDIGTKQERNEWVEDFKVGKIDILFVYNMLLTGFDAKRLKKLYLGRVIRKHNLLQALTRVNRTYKNFRYGYIVDFADIQKEFDVTNKAYFDELQAELGDELEHYSHLFKSQDEIKAEINAIKDALFRFDTKNAENFSQQINEIQDRDAVLAIKKALADARSLYNIIRLQVDDEFLAQLDFQKLNVLYREASNHLDLLNQIAAIEKGTDTTNLLNVALEDVIFKFVKIGEAELVLADKLKDTLRRTREALASNFDQQDPKFVSLKAELERLFKKKNLSEVTQEEMNTNIGALDKIHEQVKELNRQNNQLKQKYQGDPKYTRLHKRLLEQGGFSNHERHIFEALSGVKHDIDEQVLENSQIMDNESYFERLMMPLVIRQFNTQQDLKLNPDTARSINHLIVAEYLHEYNTGARAW